MRHVGILQKESHWGVAIESDGSEGFNRRAQRYEGGRSLHMY